MLRQIRYPILVTFLVMICGCGGCVSTIPRSYVPKFDPFSTDYSPIARIFDNPNQALDNVVEILEGLNFEVEINSIFLTAKTLPKYIGYQYWKATNEKWEILYQFSIQVYQSSEDKYYWKLSTRIIGSRSGHNDRLFDPADFEVTEKMLIDINQKLNNFFNKTD